MGKNLARILVGLVIAGVLLMWKPISKSKPAAVFAETNSCRLTTLNGSYGLAFSGYVDTGSPGSPVYTPVAGAGTITFHHDGTLTRAFNISFGGATFPVNDTGTYSLDSGDCNFTATLQDAGETWNLIPVAEGFQIEFFVNLLGAGYPRIGAGTMTHQ